MSLAVQDLARSLTAAPRPATRFASVVSVDAAAGAVLARPTGAPADGSGDLVAHYLGGAAPGVGARVRIEMHQGDALAVGAVGPDAYPGQPFATAAGQVALSLSSAAFGTAAVAFPAGRFASPPVVTLGKGTNGGKMIPQAGSITKDGFTARIDSGDGSTYTGTVTVYWVAVQMRSDSAAG